MIERISAAIYKAREENIERPLRDKTTLEAMAKAAIEAMCDPTVADFPKTKSKGRGCVFDGPYICPECAGTGLDVNKPIGGNRD